MAQKRANNPRLSVKALDQLITNEFVDWFKNTVRSYYSLISQISSTHVYIYFSNNHFL